MKKSFLLFLSSIMTVFLIAGCAEDTTNGGTGNNDGGSTTPTVTTPTLSDIKTFNGTYEIEFFYVNAVIAALASDCSKVETYAPGEKTCNDPAADSVSHYGQVTMKVNTDGSVKVLSKVQINGGIFDQTEGMGSLINSMAGDKRYNFTEFTTIPANAITQNALNDDTTSNQVTGTYGRSANKLVDEGKSVNNTFKFTVEPDGTVVNILTDVTVMPANTIIRMKKVSDDVVTLDPNTSYEQPAINNFDAEAARYTLKNN